MARRPLIAVTGSRIPASFLGAHLPSGLASTTFDMLSLGFAERLGTLGATTVVLPTHMSSVEVLERVDGVVVSGGADVDPASYGEAPSPHLGVLDRRRDRVEMAIVRRAIELGVPLLGVCRGLHVVNVARGGTLHQHLATADAHDVGDRPSHEGVHPIVTVGDGLVSQMYESGTVVNSMHHQGIDRIGTGLRVGARAPDGVVEAIESTLPGVDVLAVQWHPELLGHIDPSFEWLVDRASSVGEQHGRTHTNKEKS